MIDTSEGKKIIIEDNSGNKCEFIGSMVSPYSKRHGYDEKVTLSGVIKPKYISERKLSSVTVDNINEVNKKTLNSFFKKLTRINLIKEDNLLFGNVYILGEELKFEEAYDVNGNVYFSTSFEVS